MFGDCVGVGVVSQLMRNRLDSHPPGPTVAPDPLSSTAIATSPNMNHNRLLDEKGNRDERLCETTLSDIEPTDASSMALTAKEQQSARKSATMVESVDL